MKENFSLSLHTIEKAKEFVPVFHTRNMRKKLMQKYGRVTPSMKKSVMRKWYKDLTGDCSGSCNLHEEEIDERVRLVLEMEDPDVLLDLRALNRPNMMHFGTSGKNFLMKTLELLWMTDDMHRWVNPPCTGNFNKRQVRARPEGTKIPSESWLRLQFWPKSHHCHSKIHYTGKLKVKFMVQARQFRKSHFDAHYAAALF